MRALLKGIFQHARHFRMIDAAGELSQRMAMMMNEVENRDDNSRGRGSCFDSAMNSIVRAAGKKGAGQVHR
jgi:hypothetical protein